MRLKYLILASCLTIFNFTSLFPLLAQDPPAKTYSPGFWQPRARVNLKRPVEIKLINQTNINLEYDLSENIEQKPERLLSGKTSTLKNPAVPAYILINPDNSTPNTSSFNLKYEISTTDNVVTVKIKKVSSEIPGDTTLNLQETGAIYVY
jgi:hypothetical protein